MMANQSRFFSASPAKGVSPSQAINRDETRAMETDISSTNPYPIYLSVNILGRSSLHQSHVLPSLSVPPFTCELRRTIHRFSAVFTTARGFCSTYFFHLSIQRSPLWWRQDPTTLQCSGLFLPPSSRIHLIRTRVIHGSWSSAYYSFIRFVLLSCTITSVTLWCNSVIISVTHS